MHRYRSITIIDFSENTVRGHCGTNVRISGSYSPRCKAGGSVRDSGRHQRESYRRESDETAVVGRGAVRGSKPSRSEGCGMTASIGTVRGSEIQGVEGRGQEDECSAGEREGSGVRVVRNWYVSDSFKMYTNRTITNFACLEVTATSINPSLLSCMPTNLSLYSHRHALWSFVLRIHYLF